MKTFFFKDFSRNTAEHRKAFKKMRGAPRNTENLIKKFFFIIRGTPRTP